ncbi:MetQ/NlpA family ABC transporter substrate-binding protein [Paenibacillus sp. WLX2291]|uniref:MetQ/NlpA family ABC transporter substrate-binding protein n=1 Tax=Paenibacillus sp. WLX2291 TaxID=3296934 RepID=UPI0039840558
MKKWATLLVLLTVFGILAAACGNSSEQTTSEGAAGGESKQINIGATTGPYSDMITKAIKPILEKKGYTVEVTEFNDYVQPNQALANGSIDANLFQHRLYLEQFTKDNNLELSPLITVPTAPLGIYSSKYKSIDEIADGSTVALANDPTNLGRALLLLQDNKLLEVNKDMQSSTASEKDVSANPKNLVLQPLEAAQLPRTLQSVDVDVIPGNFALSAGIDLNSALQLENMDEQYRNLIAVRTADVDSTLAKDLKEAVQSAEFEQIIDSDFQGFSKPEWMQTR